ncbi:MAG: flagellar hook protein FlgE [Lautropia sp.]
MGFQQGLAGLNAAARNLDVIGNNVANTNTVGFKSARAEFADVYATTVYGVGNATPGIGVSVADLAQQFTQGDLTTTHNSLDVAINGSGFFRMSEGGSITYTRNGQFQLDKDGYIVNSNGARLTGYPVDQNGVVNNGVPQDLRLDTSDIPPRTTSAARVTINLDARTAVPTTPFDVTDGSSYNGGSSVSVYDSLGREHALAMYFRKTGDNSWEVHATSDGVAIAGGPIGTLSFNTDGSLNQAASTIPMNVMVPVGTDAGGTQAVAVSMPSATQFGADFSVSELRQDGFAAGRLAGFSVGRDGAILSRYTNGETLPRGKISLANFTNPQGLQSIGGNQWAETADSGPPLVGSAGAGSLGVLQSGALESSNVDLTAELVNMITAQRVYQANAQTIRTHDQLLQTIVNLR